MHLPEKCCQQGLGQCCLAWGTQRGWKVSWCSANGSPAGWAAPISRSRSEEHPAAGGIWCLFERKPLISQLLVCCSVTHLEGVAADAVEQRLSCCSDAEARLPIHRGKANGHLDRAIAARRAGTNRGTSLHAHRCQFKNTVDSYQILAMNYRKSKSRMCTVRLPFVPSCRGRYSNPIRDTVRGSNRKPS